MNHILKRLGTVVFFMALVSFSWAQSQSGSATSAASGPAAGTPAPDAKTSPAPTDPQIAHIVVTADQVDIDAGKMAEKKSKNKEVQAFAKQMVTDHTSVNQQAKALVKKLKVTPEESETSKTMKKNGEDSMASLKKLNGSEFDKAYVGREVAYHKQVLEDMDKVLIPNAKNPELKSLIEKTRPAIQAHLAHAEHLQSTLNK